MTPEELRKIITEDGVLFNARFHKDADTIACVVTEKYGPVTVEEAKAVLAKMNISQTSGKVIP